MSALGQKQTCAVHKPMSALCQKRTQVKVKVGKDCLGELHQFERCKPVRPVRIAETFAHLKMVEARCFDQFDRLSGALHRRGKIAALTLELRRTRSRHT